VLQLLNAGDDVIFDGAGQRQIVRRNDQVHKAMMLPV
jgi:hypothetical protein